MRFQRIVLQAIILPGIIFFSISCVKDGMPPDCKKPAKPTIPSASISVNNGDTLKLHASAPAGAGYVWTGPNGFYSTSSAPVLAAVSIANSGTYWVKVLVGYCYSDSVATNVNVISDTTCSLPDNGAVFPNGSSGPFTLSTSCALSSNGSYQINAKKTDSSLFITIRFSQKPNKGGKYNLTSNSKPGSGQVYYELRDQNGIIYTNNTGVAYVKVGTNKLNVVICQVRFDFIGVFSANIACN